ncbi:MAG: serine/threonine-protein kinase, partial [Burkholderiales bacterium]|nr:serine/threonine-protein kinase [Burkholderiales bacterium]
GRGGMGEVYAATRSEPAFEQHAALKLLRREASTQLERFHVERRILARMEHPGIARLLDGGVTAEGRHYTVMEYIEGVSLTEYCRVHSASLSQRLALFDQVCSAVAFAHRNLVIHRDLKPDNILVDSEGAVKLLDFGIAKLLDFAVATGEDEHTVAPFTPDYAAPEQLTGAAVTTGTDIYALGVVMFQMLTGRLPFTADNIAGLAHQVLNADPPLPSEFRTDVPTELDLVVSRAMARDQVVRYMTWEQFANDLAAIASGAPLPKHGVLDTEKFNILRTLSFFKSFGDVELWEVLRFSEWVDFAKDEVIINEGEPGDFFGIIVSGEARVLRKRRLLLSLLKAGECVGEMAYLGESGSLRSADVVAATPVRMIKISVKALEHASELCRLNFDRTYLRILVGRLAAANSKLAGI